MNDGTCLDPSFTVPTFSTPQAALEVELLMGGTVHSLSMEAPLPRATTLTRWGICSRDTSGARTNCLRPPTRGTSAEIAEVVIYKVALIQSDIDAVTAYLKSRWGL